MLKMNSSLQDKLNLSAPALGKSRSSKEKTEFESMKKFEDILNCSADAALQLSKPTSKASKKKLSFLERQKLRFKLLEGTTQKVSYSQNTECKDKLHNKSKGTIISSDIQDTSLKSQLQIEEKVKSKFKIPKSPSLRKKSEIQTNQSNLLPDKKIFINNEYQKCSIDFQTGSGKKIEISERAIKRASKIFDDITDISPSDKVDESYHLNVSIERKVYDELSSTSENRDGSYKLGLNTNILKDKLSQWGEQGSNVKNVPDYKRKFEKKCLNTNVPQSVPNKDNMNELLPKQSEAVSDVETELNKSLNCSISSPKGRRLRNKSKRSFNNNTVASPNNKNFTQVSDTQMCWVADNAECLAEATDSQWNSECHISSTQIKTEIFEDGFEDLSTQEAEFLGNMSFRVQSNSCKSNDTDSEELPTQILNNFRGFSGNEIKEASKLTKLYIQTTNYIKKDINKKKFFPITFIFEDVKLNLDQTKTVNSYSLRSSQCKSPTSKNLKQGNRKSKRESPKISKNKMESILKSTLKNNQKRSLTDINLTLKKKDNPFDENFINELEKLPSPLSPARKRSRESNFESNSSLSSLSRNKSSEFSGISPRKNDERRNKKSTSKHVTKSAICENATSITDEIKSTSTKANFSDDIFETLTQVYKPVEESHLEPELFEDYDLFEEETLTSTSSPKIKDTTSYVSGKDSQEYKRKSTSEDKSNSDEKKRMRISNKEENVGNKLEVDVTKSKETEFGFSTARDKKVVISAESLDKAPVLLIDCNMNKEENSDYSIDSEKIGNVHENLKDNSSDVCEKNLTVSATKKNEKLEKIFKKKKKSNNSDGNFSPNENAFGFTTATGKQIEISKKALQDAKKLFVDCEDETVYLKEKQTRKCSSETGKKIQEFGEALENSKNISENFGFSTASGKKVEVTKAGMQKAKKMFADFEHITDKSDSESKESCELSTAGEKKIKVSEVALQKAKQLFVDCEDIIDPDESSKMKKEGNQIDTSEAAAGKRIEVSEAAMEKARKVFVDCDHSKDTSDLQSTESFVAAEKKIEISKVDLQNKEKLFDDFEIITETNYSRTAETVGFSSAAGKKIEISEEAVQKAKKIFANCEQEIDPNSKNNESIRFSTAGGKKINVSADSLQKAKTMFAGCESFSNFTSQGSKNVGFSTAAGKQINVTEEAITKARKMFADCEDSEVEETENINFSTASGKEIHISEKALQKAKQLFADSENNELKDNLENKENFQFETASGKKIQISDAAIEQARNMFIDLDENVSDINNLQSNEFRIENLENEEKMNNLTKENSKRAGHKSNISVSNTRETKGFCRKLEDTFTDYKNVASGTSKSKSETKGENNTQVSNESTPEMQSRFLKNVSSKKRLGMASCRQINISENSLKKAKSIFEDIDSPQSVKSLNLNSSFGQYSSTPLRHIEQSTSKNTSFNTPQSSLSLCTTITANGSTLLANISKTIQETSFTDTSLVDELSGSFSRFNFCASHNTSTEERKSNLMKEYELTKMKISVIETRMRMFENQQEILKSKPPLYKRLIPGHLYKLKSKSKRRITLRQAVESERPGKLTFQEALTSGVPPSVLEVTSENATKLNFFVPWWPSAHQTYPPIIQTEDKATVIPNESNNIGLCEIEPAFLTTPGIDVTLLPRGWIENHFRWIIWKLASMERSFPDKFTNCLTVENVISQLKYRYDREIDRAQRPAIRKILERDDVAGRRLILCVAAVLKIPDQKHELELTDGWYSIKATLDSPLNSLVEQGVIKSGLKVMLHGAELSNCEACHPLDTPEGVRLQIHYNSTRRAAWYCKLGFQRDPRPFCINLRTINSNGGPVSCVCAYVARVYPVSYMERLESTVIWRNVKAEQRSATEWETKQTYVMEQLQQRVQDKLEREWIEEAKNQKKNHLKLKDIKTITCPKTLYQILETSNDPDSIQEAMTPSQCLAVQDYARKFTAFRQDAISSQLRELMTKEKIKDRDVCSVLKLLLVDVESPHHSRFFSIWRPKESHFQELKEGNVIRMYNVAVKNNGSLSSVPRTQFEINLDADTVKFEHMERKVTPISQTLAPNYKPIFNEFDTVGVVVYADIEQFNQTVWLADENSSFLMIKVTEGPETCSFEGTTPGNIVSVTNLIFQKRTKLYTEAMANHYTVFSSYPNQNYLQYFLKAFIEHMPQDTEKYLEECKDNVEVFLAQNAMRSSLLNISFNSASQVDELKSRICGLNSMSNDMLTLSDEELSTIDTQDYIMD